VFLSNNTDAISDGATFLLIALSIIKHNIV